MANKILLDTNILVRFFTRDHEEQYLKTVEIFRDIESGEVEALLMDLIVAEVVYVLRRVYKHSRSDVASVLKKLLLYNHIYTENKLITFEALDIYADKNMDFADAMLCAKKKLEGFEVISFDKDIKRCLN